MGIIIFPYQSDSEGETKEDAVVRNYVTGLQSMNISVKKPKPVVVKVIEVEKRPYIKDIPLSDELLDYIWKKCQDAKISYTMLLAIFKQESDMDKHTVNYNSNGSVDLGIAQINSRSVKWLAKLANIKNPNLLNDYHSADLAIAHLINSRTYWSHEDVSDEELFDLMVISFNRGDEGCKRYVKKYGFDSNKYLQNVLKYKLELESGEE